MATPRTPRPAPAPTPRPATTAAAPRVHQGPPRRTRYLPTRITPGELAALEQLAATPSAWPDGYPLKRGDAARRLLREALSARGVQITEPAR